MYLQSPAFIQQYTCINAGDTRTFIEMKFDWHSLAIALASKVLPQPGGP